MTAVVAQSRCVLGEGALWHPVLGELLWIDLSDPALLRLDPASGTHRRLALAGAMAPLGTIALTDRPDRLMITDRRGVSILDVETGAMELFASPEGGRLDIGYNDGKVDRFGRLWIGTSDLPEIAPRGALWCLAPGARPVLAETGFAVANGPAFSPDGGILYFSDSMGRRILAYDTDRSSPILRGRRVFAEMAIDEGYPDGITVDAEGCLWVAHWDGWRVTRFSPVGERLLVVPMPAPRMTSLAFGGPGRTTLYATSARLDLSAAVLAAAPSSGDLFAWEPGVGGIVETAFRI